jgi:hypothetical protein
MQERNENGQMPDVDAGKMQAECQKMQMKHQHAIEKMQMEIQAADTRTRDRMQTDTNLMWMKIDADNRRYQDEIKSEIIKEQMKTQHSFQIPVDDKEVL